MKIIADIQIPYVSEFFSSLGEVVVLPGREMTAAHVQNADILLTRSITKVDEVLLKNSRVKFVGSPTGGADHLDVDYLKSREIAWSVAPGCNAASVADYVVSCVAWFMQQQLLATKNVTAAVVGVSHIGRRVSQKLKMMGLDVLHYDPPRHDGEPDFHSVNFSEIFDADLVCLHTPLIKTGKYPTFHFVDENFLKKMKPNAILLNAARGAVIDNHALKNAGKHVKWCLDVYENEPHVDLDIVKQAILATPHVAGYAVESKLRGTQMIYEACCRNFGIAESIPATLLEKKIITLPAEITTWQAAILQVYNPVNDTQAMRDKLMNAAQVDKCFDQMRKDYPVRHELSNVVFENNRLTGNDKTIVDLLTKE